MLSRAGKPIVACPHITDSLTEFFHQFPSVALDGELYNHDLKHDFNKISSLVKKQKPDAQELAESDRLVQFHCYDVIMPDLNFEERISFRDENVDQHWCIKHVLTVECHTESQLDDFHGQCIADGYEGSMVRVNEPYESKRSKSLMKRKDFFDAEFPIDSFVEGKGNWAGCVKAVKFRMPDGRLTANGELPEAGCRGTMQELSDILKRARRGEGPKWATIRYPNLTPDGIPRFGQVTRWYDEERDL
jgi:DNA ligase-1